MKQFLIASILLMTSATLFGQTQPSVLNVVGEQAPQQRVQIDVGMVQIHTHNANYHIAYLPFLAPLPYSYPRTTTEIPNPLVLTGTQIPQRPHTRPPSAAVTIGRR